MKLRIEQRVGEVALVDALGRTVAAVPVVLSRDPLSTTDAQALELAQWLLEGLEVADHLTHSHRACSVGCDWSDRVNVWRRSRP